MSSSAQKKVFDELSKWAKKLDDPNFAKEFEGYNKTMQFVFPDLKYNLQLIFKDKKARVVEGLKKDAEMNLEIKSELFIGISTGEMDPMELFMEGKLKPKGDMADLEKLQIFME